MRAKALFKTHKMKNLENLTIKELITSIKTVQKMKDLPISTNLETLNFNKLVAKLYCLL